MRGCGLQAGAAAEGDEVSARRPKDVENQERVAEKRAKHEESGAWLEAGNVVESTLVAQHLAASPLIGIFVAASVKTADFCFIPPVAPDCLLNALLTPIMRSPLLKRNVKSSWLSCIT